MFRAFLSNRLIQGGLAFFVIVVGGSLFYSGHVKRNTERELEQHNRFLEGLREKQNTTRPVKAVTVPSESEAPGGVNTPDATPAAETKDEAEPMDLTDAFGPADFVSAEEETPEEEAPEADVPVSPFGFGPYPEIPTDYRSDWRKALPWLWSEERVAQSYETVRGSLEQRGSSFTEYMKTLELIGRLNIQLWNEGRKTDGMTTLDETGLFYPSEPDVLYVKWAETTDSNGNPRRYMSVTIGSLQNVPIAAIEGREPPPDWIDIRDINDGIDPYEYLGLNR